MIGIVAELVKKDLKIRYSRPALGYVWSFLTPLLMAVIFYIVFGMFLSVTLREAPFFLYLLSALFPWRFFQDSVSAGVTCLYDNRSLLKESRLPQYLIPVSIVLSNMCNVLPGIVIVMIISAIVYHGISLYSLMLPALLLLHAGIAAGISVTAAALYIRWKDVKYITEIALMVLFYATPVFYSVMTVREILPEFGYRAYIGNPFVCLLTLYRAAFIKEYAAFAGPAVIGMCGAVVTAFTVFVIALGAVVYSMNKRYVSDHLSF